MFLDNDANLFPYKEHHILLAQNFYDASINCVNFVVHGEVQNN